jgi:hypothetical protein
MGFGGLIDWEMGIGSESWCCLLFILILRALADVRWAL